ncbi:MAG: hypothetical protein ACTSV2_13355 [Candidatus Thorarchaeota archaeon]
MFFSAGQRVYRFFRRLTIDYSNSYNDEVESSNLAGCRSFLVLKDVILAYPVEV